MGVACLGRDGSNLGPSEDNETVRQLYQNKFVGILLLFWENLIYNKIQKM